MRLALIAAIALIATVAQATTVKELVRIEGQGESVVWGLGLVTGLAGTGDSGKELAMARPLAAVLENAGNKLGSPKDLVNSKSVALVIVKCDIPAAGARADDTLDVSVTVVNSASSLKGGELFLAPLRGPMKDDTHVYAVASGLVDVQDSTVPTAAKVRHGARVTRDILMPPMADTFNLIIDSPFAGWAASSQIAVAINAKAQPQGPKVALAVDERTIRVTVPEPDRVDRAGFLADVLSAEVNAQLLDIPAQVIVNQRTGSIIVTGDVEISPVAITQKDLTITTIVPAPVPNAQNPQIQRDKWAQINSGARPSEMAKLADLIKAFKQLDIPVTDQISILQMLHKTGKLQAKLVVD